jgi:hypothetical protein
MLTDETIRRVAKFFDIMSNDLLKLKKKLFELKESYSFNPRNLFDEIDIKKEGQIEEKEIVEFLK